MIIKLGCCGYQKSRKKYFEEFRLIELQDIFYRFPKQETLKKWRTEAPSDFEFSVKASQFITHPPTSLTYKKANVTIKASENYGFFKPTKEVFDAWNRTKEYCDILNAKVCIFQTPKSFRPTDENINNMISFFSDISRDDLILGWEPRGDEWSLKTIFQIVSKLDLIYVYDPFARAESLNSGIYYFRLHGKPPGRKMYNYDYTKDDLIWLQSYITSIGDEESVFYILFNNGIYSWNSAIRFKEILSKNKMKEL